jgi:hypothetical protein
MFSRLKELFNSQNFNSCHAVANELKDIRRLPKDKETELRINAILDKAIDSLERLEQDYLANK